MAGPVRLLPLLECWLALDFSFTVNAISPYQCQPTAQGEGPFLAQEFYSMLGLTQ